ncbi:MAG: acetylornithine transaminase [Armatimonadetes bacterium]|nr:acetylornithine transaminase [Armatimonadota bacterium]MDW8026949.1 acetylornithine transaminase [Armatimonadota bacterium]
MTLDEIAQLAQDGLTPNYSRLPVAFIKGHGTRLWDTEGKEYLDFLTGIAVCGLGHCHPKIVAALQHQAVMLWHTSNLFHNHLQAKLAKRLNELSGGYKCFFCNSGAEANEAALKLARKVGKEKLGGKWKIIAANESFHGRTFGALSVTGQPKYHKGFEPLLSGIKFVPFGDAEALEEAIDEETCAFILEPIQGESGVKVPTDDYLPKVAEICRKHNVLLVLDEVQTGMGRTGKLFAFQHYDIQPDIFTLAKSIAGGFPMGAMLTKPEWSELLQPGTHASTFGGNHLACAVALAVLDALEEEQLVEKAKRMGEHLMAKLRALNAPIKEVRGKGLIVALEFSQPIAPKVRDECLKAEPIGLIVNAIGDYIIRFLPPLTVTAEEIDQAVEILQRAISSTVQTQ